MQLKSSTRCLSPWILLRIDSIVDYQDRFVHFHHVYEPLHSDWFALLPNFPQSVLTSPIPGNCVSAARLPCVLDPVMGEFVHASRPRNSPYRHTVRWSIYDTRRTRQPQSPILWNKRRHQGNPPWPRYMELFPEMAWLYAMSTSTYTMTALPLTSLPPR